MHVPLLLLGGWVSPLATPPGLIIFWVVACLSSLFLESEKHSIKAVLAPCLHQQSDHSEPSRLCISSDDSAGEVKNIT